MIHEILPVGMLQCNCSIFGDEATREAMVVDPGDEVERILEIVRRHGLAVKSIVITHAHIDHIGGARKLKEATGAAVYMNLNDTGLAKMLDMQAAMLGTRPADNVSIDVPANDGDTLTVGAAEVHVMHTPGHTQGSICLWMPSQGKLLAGDTLFKDSIGRTDLPGGNSRQILQSIHDKLLPLPGETIVIPGHGEATSIEREKQFNYFLQGM
ncbi:MAG TPA: MBL fold metallo-hydrolase [Candidatus Acidoferrales bacterium]|nr:MBL fold metallo-hydrolase [Candidatus Acidoferrales bacterium]